MATVGNTSSVTSVPSTSGGANPTPSITTPCDAEIYVVLSEGREVSGSMLVDVQVAASVEHLAYVEIASFELVYVAKSQSTRVGAGLAIDGCPFPSAMIYAMAGNFNTTTNAMNTGVQVRHTFTWPGETSNQLKPVPSNLPRARFYFDCDAGVTAILVIGITKRGMMRFVGKSCLK